MNIAREQYYQAVVDKQPDYAGLFYFAVKTTGIFCRPTCPARIPVIDNCVFFQTTEQAIAAHYRPCLRCRPLQYPFQPSSILNTCLDAIDEAPSKRWTEQEIKALCIDPSTVRRQFKQRFGMTMIQYCRLKRVAGAIKAIATGQSVTTAQHQYGFDSSSGFRDACGRIFGCSPTTVKINLLHADWIDTPLGTLLAIADDNGLYLLRFVDTIDCHHTIKALSQQLQAVVVPGKTLLLHQIQDELVRYFNGDLQQFNTPIQSTAANSKMKLWQQLQQISFGQTRSFQSLRTLLGHDNAENSIASILNENPFHIIVPCHRLLLSDKQSNDRLNRSAWLRRHEQRSR